MPKRLYTNDKDNWRIEDINFSTTCPHCHTRSAAFHFLSGVYLASYSDRLYTLAACNKCDHCVMAVFEGYETLHRSALTDDPSWLFPSPISDIPPYTPANIKSRYEEALKSIGSESYESAVMMLRKILALALDQIDPCKGRKLVKHIRDIARSNLIPKELVDFADVVRLGGNEAAHDESVFSTSEVQALEEFTRLIFTYLFTLPGMLNEWKGRFSSSHKVQKKEPPVNDTPG